MNAASRNHVYIYIQYLIQSPCEFSMLYTAGISYKPPTLDDKGTEEGV
jgi:hypothetical protein